MEVDKPNYKACVAKLFSYELGQLRKQVPLLTRRLPQEVDERGKKIRRRNKFNAVYDPKIHCKGQISGTDKRHEG